MDEDQKRKLLRLLVGILLLLVGISLVVIGFFFQEQLSTEKKPTLCIDAAKNKINELTCYREITVEDDKYTGYFLASLVIVRCGMSFFGLIGTLMYS